MFKGFSDSESTSKDEMAKQDPWGHRGFDSTPTAEKGCCLHLLGKFGSEEVDVVRTLETQRCTNVVTWSFIEPQNGRKQIIELKHGKLLGKRKLRVNGEVVFEDHQLIDKGSRHQFNLDEREYTVSIIPDEIFFLYELDVGIFRVRPYTGFLWNRSSRSLC